MSLSYGSIKFNEDGTVDRKKFLDLLSYSQANQVEAFNDICDLLDIIAKKAEVTKLKNNIKYQEKLALEQERIQDFHNLLTGLYNERPAEYMAYTLLHYNTIMRFLASYENLLRAE